MAKYLYPAFFKLEENGMYTVKFLDLPHCYTQGDNLTDAHEMATDVLNLTLYGMEEEQKPIPPATSPNNMNVPDGCFVTLIAADTLEYRKFYDNKAVKKTLSIPQWLNTLAEREDINFSQVLQEALKERLHVQ